MTIGLVAFGSTVHADDVIPVSSLTPGSFAANAFSGFTTPTTTVSAASGFNLLSPSPDSNQIAIFTNYVVRDSQCSMYSGIGSILLRLSGTPGSQTCLYFDYSNVPTGGDIRVGIRTGFDETVIYPSGTNYPFYVNTNVAASAEGIAAGFTNSYSSGDLFTFGVKGFEVYLQWNGVDLLRYTEWRLMTPGRCAVWTHQSIGVRDITVHYPPNKFLYSNPNGQMYDPRDFGMRAVAATTGSMASGSNQITGVTAGSFLVGDQVIVCIGGETGAGARGTLGVGGTFPALNYANTTAMNADTSQATGTFAYDASSNPRLAYIWNGSAWTHNIVGGGGGVGAQSYYTEMAIPLPLIAKVTAVSGTTVTLDKNASNATTNADIRLDCLPSFFIFNQVTASGSVPPSPVNMTVAIPSSQSTADQCWYMSSYVVDNIAVASGLKVQGAGRTLTTFKAPKSCPPGAFNFNSINVNNVTLSDMNYIGNNGANGYGFVHGVNTYVGLTYAFVLSSLFAGSTGLVAKNLDGADTIGEFVAVTGDTSLIDNCTVTMNGEQREYVGWQIQLSNCTNGTMQNCTATGTFLLKSFEMFNCISSKIVNCGGTNPIYSVNSSSGWTIDCRGLTTNYLTGCYANQLSGALDEGIFQATSNAFHTGGSGTLYLGRHIQQGYIDASHNSLKFIQVSSDQPSLSIIGSYPGAGGCSTTLDGLLQAPDYDAGSGEYGAMAVISDAASTSVTGIRIKGAAIGTPGHSSHFGNISATGATSSVTNCVADVIQTGPTLSGNQTNTAYGGC